MARNQRTYDNEYKAQAVKLAQEMGGAKAAKELGIPDGTIYFWVKAFKEGRLSTSEASHILILSILVYTFFTRIFDLMLPLVVKYSIVAA